ncbi:DUF6692 family protein [Microvirga sp. GCM10011540]|uniref:DUF6692 family protein n=1 Tax=Microvirga sp. GCM10011540 TaxID=3317338 RepID=UPI0036132EEE
MRTLSSWGGQAHLAFVVGLGMIVAGCSENEAPDDDLTSIRAPEIARIVPAQEALAGSNIPTLDPAPMNDAEIRKALGAGPLCEFRYTTAGRPVLAVGTQPDGAPRGGIVKLNGSMVPLSPAPVDGASGAASTLLLVADPIRMTVTPEGAEQTDGTGAQRREANAVLEVGQSLRVGYRGYLDCISEPPRKSPRWPASTKVVLPDVWLSSRMEDERE